MAHCERSSDSGVLTTDVLREVLKRVNGATMARASCVSTQFRSLGDEEPFWENLCHQRWPSITELAPVKELVSSMGGFRKLYSNCFPFILCDSKTSARARRQECYDDSSKVATAASGLVSIVDVSCHGEALLSRIVTGVPGATAVCGRLVDVAGEGVVGATESIMSLSSLWEVALCSQIRLSWILIDKETHQAVNLSSWKPLNGGVHRNDDNTIVLHFGSMLPSTSTTTSPVHCNVTMQCATTVDTDRVRVTELGMHLEDVHGVHLRGHQAIAALSNALHSCNKTMEECHVEESFRSFMASQISNQEWLMRREIHRQIAGAVFFISAFVIGMNLFI